MALDYGRAALRYRPILPVPYSGGVLQVRMIKAPNGINLFIDVVVCIIVCRVASWAGIDSDDGACLVALCAGFVCADCGYALEGLFNEWRCRG